MCSAPPSSSPLTLSPPSYSCSTRPQRTAHWPPISSGHIITRTGRVDLDVRLETNTDGSAVVLTLRGAANLQPPTDSESNERIISPFIKAYMTNGSGGTKGGESLTLTLTPTLRRYKRGESLTLTAIHTRNHQSHHCGLFIKAWTTNI
jgi:hypothetical protein